MKVSPMRSVKGKEISNEMMPALLSLGLHATLCSIAVCCQNERLLVFLDDIYALCRPERVSNVYVALQEELWAHSRIQVHQGKTNCGRIRFASKRLASSHCRCPYFKPRGSRVKG